jgi:phosphoadenosine phosphosulfate reductase
MCVQLSLENETAEDLSVRFEACKPEALLQWATNRFGPKITLACSFGGVEGIIVLDMLSKMRVSPRVFVLDTGRLHEETYRTMERCRERYGIELEVFTPRADPLQSLLRKKGPFSFYDSVENRQECCFIRKVEPLRRALAETDHWVTGLRRQQSITRHQLPKVENDVEHGSIFKLNPLADWTDEQVWEYAKRENIPYNKLHDQGYPSVGCAPCSRAVLPGEDIRAGRWWWESAENKECGLHVVRG